ncbi:MAG: PAS domain S-box protein [Anaerolineae bacterium]
MWNLKARVRRLVGAIMTPQALPSQLDWMQQTIQTGPSGVILVDARLPNMPVVFVNETFESLTGYSKEEALGKNCRFLFGSDHDQPELAVLRQSIAAQIPCTVTLRNYRKDGTPFWNELRLFPLRDTEGKVTHFVGIQNDVTVRKEAEAALAQSEARYRQIFDTNRAIKLLIDPSTGKIKDANLAAIEFYGYSLDQILSMRIQDLNVLTDEQVSAEMKRAVSQNQTFFEFRHRLASGEIRDVDVFSSPVNAPEGQYLYSIIVDVTGKRQSEIRYRSLFEQSNDAVFVFDLTGHHLQVNQRAAEMLGYTQEELIGKSYLDFVAPDDQPNSADMLQRVGSGEFLPPYERVFLHRDGTLIHTEVNAEVVRSVDGTPLYIQSIVRDITIRKCMEEQLRESEQKFRAFVEQSSDGVVMVDDTGMVIEWNQSMAALTGWSSAEVLGRPLWDIQYAMGESKNKTPEWYDYLKTLTLRICQTGTGSWLNQPSESFIPQPDGTRLAVQSVMFPIKVSNGYWIGSMIRDVSKRKWMEESLRASEERQRALLQAIPDLIFRTKHDGTYVDLHVNDPNQLRKPMDQYVGRNLRDMLPEPIAASQLAKIQEAIRTGTVVTYEFDLDVRGSLHHFELRVVPSGDDEALTVAHDTTELWLMRRRLEQLNARLEFSVDAARIAWWELNIATNEVQFDPRKVEMLGYDAKDFLNAKGDEFMQLVHPDDRVPVMSALNDLIAGRAPLYLVDYRSRNAQGQWMWFQDRGELICNDQEQMVVRGYAIDITQRKQAQQREIDLALERERSRLLSEFVQGAAHEFRTPLSVISSSAYLLSRISDEAKRVEKIEQIDAQVKRITRLVNMLLMMVKLESRNPLECTSSISLM